MAYETPRILSDQPLEPHRGDDRRAYFHFDEYAITLARLIAAKSTRTPLTIGVYGPWGSGKTTLTRRVMALLQGQEIHGRAGKVIQWKAPEEASDFRLVKPIWFNAWKYHEEDSLLAALIRAILQEMARGNLFEKVRADWEQKDIDLFSLFVSAFRLKFGMPGVAEAEFQLNPKAHEQIPEFKQHLAFFDAFEETLEHLIDTWAGQEGILVVFIDDLDRCPPDRIVQVLEAIKLFLDKTDAVFVLAADEEAVLRAVMHHYREAITPFDGEATPTQLHQWARDYMEKIVQLRFPLPSMREKTLLGQEEEEGYFSDLTKRVKLKGTWAIPQVWQQVLVAAADTNPRKVKTFLNDLNLAWAMLRNSGQIPAGVKPEAFWPQFVGLHALLRAAPAGFVERLRNLSGTPTLWQQFWQETLDWAQGKELPEATMSILNPFQAAKGFRRALGVWGKMAMGVPDARALAAVLFFAPPSEAETAVETLDAPLQSGTPLDILIVETEGLNLPFVRVPAGTFLMGSAEDDEMAFDDEKPQHEQNIPYDYWIGRFPVTWQQFVTFDREREIPEGKENHPVVNVSWYDALKFVEWLNAQHRTALQKALQARGVAQAKAYRFMLPSEPEWEKAARGTYGNIWPWGNEWQDGLCNSKEAGIGATTPVGKYSPQGDSPYGAADMAGNVWEWERSIHQQYPYHVNDGREDQQQEGSRVLRGGSWSYNKKFARSTLRLKRAPSNLYGDVGFRVVFSPEKME